MPSIHALAADSPCAEPHARAFGTPCSEARDVPRVTIGRLGIEHDVQLCGLLLGLEPSARVNRFGHAVSNANMQAYSSQALSTAAFIAGVFLDGRIIGVVEVFAAEDDSIGELAFAIDADWRRRGLASALLEAVRGWAAQRDLRILRMVIARGNWPMRNLAAKVGARLDLTCDELHADIALRCAGAAR
jgi:GNAT superfamily N-acetyltransferase